MAVISSQVFVLCDAANVRDGLLNILGAGISSISRHEFPAQLDCLVAIQFEISGGSMDDEIVLRVVVSGGDGEQVDVPEFETTLNQTPIEQRTPKPTPALNNPSFTVPFILNASALTVPAPGSYQMALFVNDQQLSSLRFHASVLESAGTAAA